MEIKLTLGFSFVLFVVCLVALVLGYWFLLRPILRKVPALTGFYAQADVAEQGFFARLKGWRTILFARLQALGAVLVAVVGGLYQFVGPLFADHASELQQIVPSNVWPWIVVGILALGAIIGERLRRATTGPIPPAIAPVAPVA